MGAKRIKIAFWFRYGPAEHAELCHAIPGVVERLARDAEVHYYGLKGPRPVPAAIAANARLHILPLRVNRTSTRDKFVMTAVWLLLLPFIGLHTRLRGVDLVYIDETLPFSASLARIFFGRRVVITVADFFVDIYFTRGWRAKLGAWIRARDLANWTKLEGIITRAKATRDYLAKNGVEAARVFPIYDPCDMTIYRPVERAEVRKRFGYADHVVVLVHHGILHPNKGNDRILRSLARLKPDFPELRYLLIGDGSEMENLKTLARELGIEDVVRFTGWLPRLAEVNEAINAGDIGLVMRVGHQSDDFHMTGALVHSMACGLPVLAAKLGGVSEVVKEGEAGLLFPPEQMEVFEEKLARLVRDAGLRRTMGAAALAKARECFDIARITEDTAATLLRLARRGSGS